MKNFGKSSRRRSQGVPKIFRAPIYGAHCAVIFANCDSTAFLYSMLFYSFCHSALCRCNESIIVTYHRHAHDESVYSTALRVVASSNPLLHNRSVVELPCRLGKWERRCHCHCCKAKGVITSKIKHTIKHKTSPARLAQLLHNCCSPH